MVLSCMQYINYADYIHRVFDVPSSILPTVFHRTGGSSTDIRVDTLNQSATTTARHGGSFGSEGMQTCQLGWSMSPRWYLCQVVRFGKS